MTQVCQDLGVRLIAVDRPGFGLSDFQPRRRMVDFADDLRQLAAQLGLKKFALLGVSGGGPYAAACAATIPRLLSAALLVCSLAPTDAPDTTKGMVRINRWLLLTARRLPRLSQWAGGLVLKAIWGKGEQVIPKQIEARLPAVDKEALASSQLREALIASSTEALRHGVRAATTEGLLYGQPWGFSLREIQVPVLLWHGEQDVVVPPAMGRYLAERIPGCQARFYPEDGHFSLPFIRIREILSSAVLMEK